MLFISHSTIDKPAALDLQQRLRRHGYSCEQQFLDSDQRSGIKLGDRWEKVIYDNLRDCRALLVLCSPNWLQSKWCFAELAAAKMSGKQIFPIVLEECDLSALCEYQAVFINMADAAARENAFVRLLDDLEERGLGPTAHLPWPNPELKDPMGQIDDCPFPGLAAFDERYAAVYFGRERETQVVLEQLLQMRANGEPRLLMIVGGSGSGKSSLLMAGVLPRLKHSTSRVEWLVLSTLRYARRDYDDALFEALADDILARYPPNAVANGIRIPNRTSLRDDLAAEDPAQAAKAFLAATRDLAFVRGTKDATVLLPIDQFEEFLVPSAGLRAAKFLTFLEKLCQHRNDRLLVIGTMRSDYLDVYERHPHALKAPQFHPWRLEPFPREQIQNVIDRPAARVHLEIAPELLERLKQDTPSTDALPLLAFTLEKLYRKYSTDKKLDLFEYDDMGGMEGAIRQTAEKTMAATLPLKNVESAVRLSFVKHLVEVNDKGEFVRLTARWHDLDGPTQAILDEFVSQRLLLKTVRNGEIVVEVAHEALFRCWEPLRLWLNTSVDILRWRRDINRDQKSAAASKRNWTGLTRSQLAQARDWPRTRRPELGADEIGWIEKAVRRSQRLMAAWTAIGLVVVIFGAVAWWEKGVADRTAHTTAYNLYLSTIALAHKEWMAGYTDRCRDILDSCPVDRRHWEWHYLHGLCHLQKEEYSPKDAASQRSLYGQIVLGSDARRVATYSVTVMPDTKGVSLGEATVAAWDFMTGERIMSHGFGVPADGIEVLFNEGMRPIVLSPQGRYLLMTHDGDDSARPVAGDRDSLDRTGPMDDTIWSLADGRRVLVVHDVLCECDESSVSNDGRLFVTARRDGKSRNAVLEVYALETGQLAFSTELGKCDQCAVTMSRAGDRVAATVTVLAYKSATDGSAPTDGDQSDVRVWDVLSGRQIQLIRGRSRQNGMSDDMFGEPRFVAGGANLVVVRRGGSGTDARDIPKVGESETGVPATPVPVPCRQFESDSDAESISSRQPDALAPDYELVSFTVENGKLLWAMPIGFSGTILLTVTVSPTGNHVVVTDETNLISDLSNMAVFDVRHGGRTFATSWTKAGAGTVRSSFSADGRRFIYSRDRHTVRIVDVKDGSEVNDVRGIRGTICDMYLIADDRLLVATDMGMVDVYNPEECRGSLIIARPDRKGFDNAVFTRDSGSILADGEEFEIRDAATGSKRELSPQASSRYRCIAIRPQGDWLARAEYDSSMISLTKVGEPPFVIDSGNPDEDSHILQIEFSPDGRFLAALRIIHERESTNPPTSRVQLHLWRLQLGHPHDSPTSETIELAGSVFDDSEAVSSFTFDGDGTRLIAVFYPTAMTSEVLVWEIATRSVVKRVPLAAAVTSHILSMSDGHVLMGTHVTGGRGGALVEIDLSQGRIVRTFEPSAERIVRVAKSPDLKRVATFEDDGTLKLWDADTGREAFRTTAAMRSVTALSFSPDGGKLLAAFSEHRGLSIFSRADAGLLQIWNAPGMIKSDVR